MTNNYNFMTPSYFYSGPEIKFNEVHYQQNFTQKMSPQLQAKRCNTQTWQEKVCDHVSLSTRT